MTQSLFKILETKNTLKLFHLLPKLNMSMTYIKQSKSDLRITFVYMFLTGWANVSLQCAGLRRQSSKSCSKKPRRSFRKTWTSLKLSSRLEIKTFFLRTHSSFQKSRTCFCIMIRTWSISMTLLILIQTEQLLQSSQKMRLSRKIREKLGVSSRKLKSTQSIF